jgi:hypothetical protein
MPLTLLYNLDNAREYQTGIVVGDPAAVWTFGLMALYPIGLDVQANSRQIFSAFRDRTIVFLTKAMKMKRSLSGRWTGELIDALRREMPGRIAVVECPPDLPPGRNGRKLLRQHVAKKATAQGVYVSYKKRPGY